jgi:hypothetical protein
MGLSIEGLKAGIQQLMNVAEGKSSTAPRRDFAATLGTLLESVKQSKQSDGAPNYGGANAQLQAQGSQLNQDAVEAYRVYASSSNYGVAGSPEYMAWKASDKAMNSYDPSRQMIANTYAQTGVDPYAAWDAFTGAAAGTTLANATGDWSNVKPLTPVESNGLVVGTGTASPTPLAAYSNHNDPQNAYYNRATALSYLLKAV